MIAVPLETNTLFRQQNLPRILLVDDELFNRQLLERVLQRSAAITQAEDGQQALALLEHETFDLVLLDIMMPGVKGLEVLQIIRETPKTAELPVIVISALSHNENIVQGLHFGANDYIPKPFDIEVVYARVNTQLKLKLMADRDKQAIAELEAAQQMKDRLFRIASHDLKAPLANVRVVEALLREVIGNHAAALELLDVLRMTANGMKEVIEEFIDMAACQSGNLEIDLTSVDVRQAVLDVASQYHLTAQNKDITLVVNELPGTVAADQARLTQVLGNLVSNAIKYSPPHTTVTLWSEAYRDRVRINIADQGPGIPANEHDRLFKEFSRLSNRPTGNESSTGLGLWIVQQMVMLQGGDVGVDCPPDGGSIFWLELPIYPN